MSFDYSLTHAFETRELNHSCLKVYKRWAFDLMNCTPWSKQYIYVIGKILRLCGEDFDFLSEFRSSEVIKRAVIKRLNYLIVHAGGVPMSNELKNFILER